MPRSAPNLKARALRYLATREHSRVELARKLAPHAQDSDEVEQLLDTLEAARLLSPVRFCESLLHRRAPRFGNRRILAELHSHGIDGAALADAEAELADSEISRARDAWQRRFGQPAEDAAGRGKQMRFLQQRGFSPHAIRAVLGSISEEDGSFDPDVDSE